jgi:hypothetical protein
VTTATLIGAVFAVLLALAPAGASAAGKTFFVGPSGKGNECIPAEPCTIKKAVELAGDGDTVTLAGGHYTTAAISFSGVRIEHELTFGAGPGETATIETTSSATINVDAKAGATLHDLRFVGAGPLNLESGSADRIYVEFFGEHEPIRDIAACELGVGAILRDSVCWAREGGEESTEANAIQVVAGGAGVTGTAYLRNDTGVAIDAGGHGLLALAANGANLTVDAEGVIAQAFGATDVASELALEGNPESKLTIVHSDFTTMSQELPYATVTAPGTEGNTTAPPLFVDALGGDFHQAVGSPTIDGGLTDSHTGALDLDGTNRAKPGCVGAEAVPDMGAYEFNAVAACPVPPPPPPPPPAPKPPVFRILKVLVHGSGGKIQVEVPNSGTVSLTGLGVKLVARPAPGPGAIVTLPVRPWAITKVRLNKAGKTRVHLVVKFEPTVGVTHEKRRNVLLKKG